MAEIKPEMTFGINKFGEQNKLTTAQTVAQVLVNLLFMKPGQLPSLPHLGIDIEQYLYKFEDEINTTEIRDKIINQCPLLLTYLNMGEMQVLILPYNNESILYIYIPLLVKVDNVDDQAIVVGAKKSNTNQIAFNYKITDAMAN